MCYIYVAGAVSLLLVIYYYLTKNYGHWESKSIPCVKGALPGLGNVYPLFLLWKNVTQMYQELYDKMPGCSIAGFYYATEPAVLVRDPEVIKSVLQTNFLSFSSNGANLNLEFDSLLSRNPFFLQGEKWKSSRQQLSSAYTSGKLKYMYESIDTVCAKLIKYIDNQIEKSNGKAEVELKELYSRYTAEVVASAAFGVEGNSFNDSGDRIFIELGRSIFEPTFMKGLTMLTTLFLPFLAKIFKTGFIPPEVDKVFRKLVKDMLCYRADQNVERPDFLQLMINYKKSGAWDHGTDGNFTDETITSHSASFFMEGYETSSITLSFVLYELASHPEVQQRLRDEVLTAVEKHGGITYEALQEMSYMDKVIHESMRLYAPAGTLFKVCTKEIELKGPDGITCPVTPGTRVMIPLQGLHMDPEYWPEPEKFDPERFSEENKQKRHKFVYLPWGEGPRVCVGIRMAMLQIKAAIATTIKNYSLELSPRTQLPIKLDPYYFMASALGGLWVNLKPL